MKPTALRGILHYVPQFRNRVFFMAVDGEIVITPVLSFGAVAGISVA